MRHAGAKPGQVSVGGLAGRAGAGERAGARGSVRLLRALARFGLTLNGARSAGPAWANCEQRGGVKRGGVKGGGVKNGEAADELTLRVADRIGAAIGERGGDGGAHAAAGVVMVCITGPSGSGKSTLVRGVAKELGARGFVITEVCAGALVRETRVVADLFAGSIGSMLGALSWAGLAEVPLLARRAKDLSEGQRWRLALARAIEGGRGCGAVRREALIADEFCSTLDRTTAVNLCRSLRRGLRSGGVRVLICASAHGDIVDAMGPDVLVRLDGAGRASVSGKGGAEMRGRAGDGASGEGGGV